MRLLWDTCTLSCVSAFNTTLVKVQCMTQMQERSATNISTQMLRYRKCDYICFR
jgi:hypothetical protein